MPTNYYGPRKEYFLIKIIREKNYLKYAFLYNLNEIQINDILCGIM